MTKTNLNEKITEYHEFISKIEELGFMTLSNNSINFPNLTDLTIESQWHTGEKQDPWIWRVNIEKDKKAGYGKLFAKKPGFISIEWYPKFLSARRSGKSFSQMYSEGLLSNYSKQIYDLFEKNETLAVHEIKSLGGFTKETISKYESAMCELQMAMLITVNGTKQKISSQGEPYGWPSTAYSTVETWAGDKMIEESLNIKPKDAISDIYDRASKIIPDFNEKKMKRFLGF